MNCRGIGGGLLAAVVLATTVSGCGAGSGSVPSDCKAKHQFETLEKGFLTVSSYTYSPATIVRGDTLEGVEGELLREVAKLECLEIKLIEQAAAGVIPAVQAGRADLAAGDWYRTRERAKALNLTDPLYSDAMVLVSEGGTVATVDNVVGKKVGTFEGNLWNEDMKKLLGGNLKVFPTEAAMFQDLAAGRLQVAIDGAAGATNMIKTTRKENLKMRVPPADPRVAATSSPGQAGWPHRKGNDAMTKALNEDIASLRQEGVIARALKKYGLPESSADVGKPNLL
ncbi:transporter substrate-binding domain-containing protein [Actinomadura sp. B10D3]|uniref:substrate-binding periplasmic protein n=1 Tax=Actinomadura sp. B10D3 TaxID=3153557 RepID=UPI00325EF0C7